MRHESEKVEFEKEKAVMATRIKQMEEYSEFAIRCVDGSFSCLCHTYLVVFRCLCLKEIKLALTWW